MNYIKHTILPAIIALAWAVVSCTSAEPVPDAPKSQEEMAFDVATRSRVVATTDSNIIEKPFMLFGDVNLGGDNLKTIFDWHSVAYKNNAWDYGIAKQYWYMGQEHSFVALHPFIDEDNEQVVVLTYDDNKLSFTYSLPDKMENACDLLFATHRRKYTLDNTGPVYFEFRHLLARINISLALIEKDLMYDHVNEGTEENPYNKNEYIAVHSIEFNNIITQATFDFYPEDLTSGITSTYNYKKRYTPDKTQTIEQKTVTLNKTQKVPNGYKEIVDENGDTKDVSEIKYVTALTEQEVIVMLPQTFGENSEATMVVNYSINDDVDLMRRIVIPLKNTEWKEGVSYTYKFLIDNAYFGHIVDESLITVEIDDKRLPAEHDEYDDSWITDNTEPSHNINYGYDEGEGGNCGPTN